MTDSIAITESVAEYRARHGSLTVNEHGRVTSQRWSKAPRRYETQASKLQKGRGYISRVGGVPVRRDATMQEVARIIQAASPTSEILEFYPTRFCTNCTAPSWFFVDYEREGHSTCTRCGVVQNCKHENITLYMGEEGHATKSQWETTPGMTADDCQLYGKRGTVIQKGFQRPKSHLRNYWRIKKKIDDIADEWQFGAVETMAKCAKTKLRLFYKRIHGQEDDESEKMPHGGAAIAAACFYATVLEFEKRTHIKTVCTLPAIARAAQAVRDHKRGRRTRDVTENVILRYTKKLKKYELCHAPVPEIGAKTLQFTPKSASLEHARMSMFSECRPARFFLPVDKSWGMKVGDTKMGALYVESVDTASNAFLAGIRKNDYIFQMNKENVGVDYTPSKFATHVQTLKRSFAKPVIEVTIMRKKKN